MAADPRCGRRAARQSRQPSAWGTDAGAATLLIVSAGRDFRWRRSGRARHLRDFRRATMRRRHAQASLGKSDLPGHASDPRSRAQQDDRLRWGSPAYVGIEHASRTNDWKRSRRDGSVLRGVDTLERLFRFSLRSHEQTSRTRRNGKEMRLPSYIF